MFTTSDLLTSKIYVGDWGVSETNTPENNSRAIEAACAFARLYGGSLVFPPGNIEIKHRIIIDWDGGYIRGQGRDETRIFRSTDFDMLWTYGPTNYGRGSIVQFVNVDFGGISDITVDGVFRVSTGTHGTGNPICLTDCSNMVVENTRVKGITGHTYGIWVNSCQDTVVRNNHVSGSNPDAHQESGYTHVQELIEISGPLTRNILIENNTVELSSARGIYGFVTDRTSVEDPLPVYDNVRVIGNTVRDCAEQGIFFELSATDTTTDPDGVITGTHISIEDNVVYRTIPTGTDPVVLPGEHAIRLSMGTASTAKNYVKVNNNRVINTKQGISLLKIREFEVNGNELDNVDYNYSSIFIYECIDGMIGGNRVLNAGKYKTNDTTYVRTLTSATGTRGISSVEDTSGSSSNITIHNNSVIEATLGGIYADHSRVYVRDNMVLNCNTAGDSTFLGYGIVLTEDCDDSELSGNNIVDNRSTKKHVMGYMSEGVRCVIRDNKTDGTTNSGVIPENVINNHSAEDEGVVTVTTSPTTVTAKRKSSNDKVVLVQMDGASLTPSVPTLSATGFSFTHSGGSGERFYWKILP